MDYLYIVLSGEQLSTAPAAEQLLLIYDFNSKEWWRGSCLNALCDGQWNRWRENPDDKQKSTSALWELGSKPGGSWSSRGQEDPSNKVGLCLWPVQVSPWGCGMPGVCTAWWADSGWTFLGCLLAGMRTILLHFAAKIPWAIPTPSSSQHCPYTLYLSFKWWLPPFCWVFTRQPWAAGGRYKADAFICSWRPL